LRTVTFTVLASFFALLLLPAGARPQGTAPTCDSEAAFHALDFWIGTWRVTVDGTYAGDDTVTSELSRCAVMERWSDADGSHGVSLFVYDSFGGNWKQTWVTDRATAIGGLKYKTLVARYPNGGTRFEGTLPVPAGHRPVLDRTTLTPLANGTVRQVIEYSTDGGTTWTNAFDAIYTRSNTAK
jgi:hypothetical protein